MTIVLFEDEQVTRLYPVTIGKPAFGISCGSYRLLDLVAGLGRKICYVVRPHLRAFWPSDEPNGSSAASSRAQTVLVNARLVPSVAVAGEIKKAIAAARPGVVFGTSQPPRDRPPAVHEAPNSGANTVGGSHIALAVLPPGAPVPAGDTNPKELYDQLGRQGLQSLPGLTELPLLEYPHDIIRHHLATLGPNLEHRLAAGDYREVADGVFAAAEACLGEYVVANTAGGPIVLDERASIGPYCYLSGPAYLGAGARVIEHAAIKDGVALGHTTKIGGEIEGSIIEPFTNKQHHGFLGHSYLGSWVNLGAGTCNSDLKNTYGQVNMEYQGRKVATGMQFVGSIVGDYAKTAINTGIFTGKTVGACSMVYGFVTTNVPSFTNYARLFGQVTEAPVEVMVATQARMFARRNVQQRPCEVQLLYDMYELTRHERQLAGEPLSL